MRKTLTILVSLMTIWTISAQVAPERERAQIIDELLADRFENLLPKLMDQSGIDMWVIIAREYNEDPVLRTMLPATWLNARRRTILVFYRDKAKNTIERLAVARYNVGKNITSAWDKEKQPDQWARLVELIEERNPRYIGVNYSDDWGIADGLVKTDYEAFMEVLPPTYESRVISAEQLAVAWIETRTAKEMKHFKFLTKLTHQIIDEAFSDKVITPGLTTTDDVVWFFRQRVTDLGLETWFHPTVDIQRTDEKLESHITSFSNRPEGQVIQPGDLLHCDFGITYLRLNTDCQRHAYVLKPGETEAPAFLQEALAKGNRVQDLFIKNFKTGRTGNAIFLTALKEGRAEGLVPSIYTHPLGYYGHSAGTTLGMWDSQDGVPGSGDYPLHKNTAYAIELNTTVNIPAWNKDIRIMLEEPGYWGEDSFNYIDGRQTKLITLSRKP
ncbi:M24 family metallopeptidase [Croceiramulus getboli]|nr:M24 family metallopeptidase [Flavobacteriaceae bacterium YJPT1-3]